MTKNPTILYEFKMYPNEGGLSLTTNEYISIKETPCYYWCISECWKGLITTMEDAKKYNKRIIKIHKTNSHKAFTTKEAAFKNFAYRKRKHKFHLESSLKFVSHFLDEVEACDKDYKKFIEKHPSHHMVNTRDMVGEFFVFD